MEKTRFTLWHRAFIISFLLLVVGVLGWGVTTKVSEWLRDKPEPQKVESSNVIYRYEKIEHDGHTWAVFDSGELSGPALGVSHHPDCPCLKK